MWCERGTCPCFSRPSLSLFVSLSPNGGRLRSSYLPPPHLALDYVQTHHSRPNATKSHIARALTPSYSLIIPGTYQPLDKYTKIVNTFVILLRLHICSCFYLRARSTICSRPFQRKCCCQSYETIKPKNASRSIGRQFERVNGVVWCGVPMTGMWTFASKWRRANETENSNI